MDIEAGQTWSVPPHGPDIYVQTLMDSVPEPIVSYSLIGGDAATYQKPLSVFQASLQRLSARLAI